MKEGKLPPQLDQLLDKNQLLGRNLAKIQSRLRLNRTKRKLAGRVGDLWCFLLLDSF